MGTVREDTNFSTDVEEFGPIGEIDLKEILSKSPKAKKIIDVSETPEFQNADIDILQYTDNGVISYEVKSDTEGYRTGNIAYEVLSNGNPGCLLRSKANYLYYVLLKNKDDKTIMKRYLIDIKLLNKWLMSEFGNINKVNYLRASYMSHGKDNTGLILIKLSKLCETTYSNKKIAREIVL